MYSIIYLVKIVYGTLALLVMGCILLGNVKGPQKHLVRGPNI